MHLAMPSLGRAQELHATSTDCVTRFPHTPGRRNERALGAPSGGRRLAVQRRKRRAIKHLTEREFECAQQHTVDGCSERHNGSRWLQTAGAIKHLTGREFECAQQHTVDGCSERHDGSRWLQTAGAIKHLTEREFECAQQHTVDGCSERHDGSRWLQTRLACPCEPQWHAAAARACVHQPAADKYLARALRRVSRGSPSPPTSRRHHHRGWTKLCITRLGVSSHGQRVTVWHVRGQVLTRR